MLLRGQFVGLTAFSIRRAICWRNPVPRRKSRKSQNSQTAFSTKRGILVGKVSRFSLGHFPGFYLKQNGHKTNPKTNPEP